VRQKVVPSNRPETPCARESLLLFQSVTYQPHHAWPHQCQDGTSTSRECARPQFARHPQVKCAVLLLSPPTHTPAPAQTITHPHPHTPTLKPTPTRAHLERLHKVFVGHLTAAACQGSSGLPLLHTSSHLMCVYVCACVCVFVCARVSLHV